MVATGEEFLALQRSVVATDPTKPHPWPVEQFLGTHPLAWKFGQESAVTPDSFATEAVVSNNSFAFVNTSGAKQVARYQILPVAGLRHLSEDEAKGKPADFLREDLKARLAKGPIVFDWYAQIAAKGDAVEDPSVAWPDSRKRVKLGTFTLDRLPDNPQAQLNLIALCKLALNPAPLGLPNFCP